MSKYKSILSADNLTENIHGEWVPAIPLPYYELKKRCDCGKRFWTIDGYRGHYAYAHILGFEADES